MRKNEAAILALCGVGFADSTYFLLNTLFPSIPLECPSSGPINCGAVTSSQYSHVLGVPVALLAVLWFGAVAYLSIARPSFYPYILFPLWAAGITMVGYLIAVEVLRIHAICLYCTLAHVCTALLGPLVYRLSFEE